MPSFLGHVHSLQQVPAGRVVHDDSQEALGKAWAKRHPHDVMVAAAGWNRDPLVHHGVTFTNKHNWGPHLAGDMARDRPLCSMGELKNKTTSQCIED